ncbi:DUF397 domain-containing protein, partial [Streptomyces sp. NEAU-H3]
MTNQSRRWVKSSYSGADNGSCVELAVGEAALPVRDSKWGDDSPVVEFGREA